MTLRRYFTLHAADREEVGRCRGAATTLGFAVQLCTLRWRGHFLRDMAGVPAAAIETLAEQLGLLPLELEASLRGYPANEDTRLDHHERIRRHLGFVRCGPAERRRLLDHMVATARAVPRAATLYPLAYWHAHLPRRFWWFLPGDFAGVPAWVERVAFVVYCLALGAYALRSAHAWPVAGGGNPGKDLVVSTTAVCWYAGIVAYDSDYAFTVTNVVIHGVPYAALVWWYARARAARTGKVYRTLARWPVFLATLWVMAYAEELLWDRGVWHERAWLFGGAWDWESLKVFLVPLLALPQATHYILDGFVWRRRGNEHLSVLSRQ